VEVGRRTSRQDGHDHHTVNGQPSSGTAGSSANWRANASDVDRRAP
jgi:hypothetical protein